MCIENAVYARPCLGKQRNVLNGDSLSPVSYSSGFALPTDRDAALRHDHRHFTLALGKPEHCFQALRSREDVDVLKILVLFFVSFPSCRGERSCVFTENQYLVRHLGPPDPKPPPEVRGR